MRLHYPALMLLLSVAATAAHGQNREAATPMATYRFGVSVPIEECSFYGVSPENAHKDNAQAGAKFTYLNEAAVGNKSRVVFQFLTYNDPELRQRYNTIRSSGTDRPATFCVDKEVFDRTASRVYDRGAVDLAAGVLVLPIKMRPGGSGRDFDFSKDVTLGTVAGPRMRLASQREFYASLLFGAGISSVSIDSANTAGVTRSTTDRSAVTLTGGLMIDYERFQIGVMTGFDWISRNRQANWLNQGKPWVAIGLGYTLLSAPPSNTANRQ